MPIFTSLLLIFVALALLPLALRSNGVARERREHARDEERFSTGALICEAAARDAFGVELDHSIESIAKLDELISQGWSQQAANPNEEIPDELSFTLASYLGDVFVRNAGARWRHSNDGWSLSFPKLEIVADPFNLIERKLRDTEHVHLHDDAALLLQELERLRHPPENSQRTITG
jgi:hypothetical protein